MSLIPYYSKFDSVLCGVFLLPWAPFCTSRIKCVSTDFLSICAKFPHFRGLDLSYDNVVVDTIKLILLNHNKFSIPKIVVNKTDG